MSTDQSEFLGSTAFIDHDHPAIAAYVTTALARAHTTSAIDVGDQPVAQAVALYYAVRDDFRYNPWNVSAKPADFRASTIVTRDRSAGGHCIDKALVLAACARHLAIPARLHFANVRNHIGTEQLERLLGTDVLVFHGYTELWLNDRWVAATPAFNKALCDKLGVAPLEFDGQHDSIFQAFDRAGGDFMEYVHDYGTYADLPFDFMWAQWRHYYPQFAGSGQWPKPHHSETRSPERKALKSNGDEEDHGHLRRHC